SLGWEDTQALHIALTSAQPTMQKVFYKLLEDRKRGIQQRFAFQSPSLSDDPMETDGSEVGKEEVGVQTTKTLPIQIRGNPRLQPKRIGTFYVMWLLANFKSSSSSAEPSNSPIIGSTYVYSHIHLKFSYFSQTEALL